MCLQARVGTGSRVTSREPSVAGSSAGAGASEPPPATQRRLRAIVLLVAGVLVFTDTYVVAIAALLAVVVMLLAIGFIERRLRAMGWAAIVVVSAFVGDVLWQLGWEPFDRSADYESIPQTPFVLLALPIPMSVIAIGVGAGVLFHRLR